VNLLTVGIYRDQVEVPCLRIGSELALNMAHFCWVVVLTACILQCCGTPPDTSSISQGSISVEDNTEKHEKLNAEQHDTHLQRDDDDLNRDVNQNTKEEDYSRHLDDEQNAFLQGDGNEDEDEDGEVNAQGEDSSQNVVGSSKQNVLLSELDEELNAILQDDVRENNRDTDENSEVNVDSKTSREKSILQDDDDSGDDSPENAEEEDSNNASIENEEQNTLLQDDDDDNDIDNELNAEEEDFDGGDEDLAASNDDDEKDNDNDTDDPSYNEELNSQNSDEEEDGDEDDNVRVQFLGQVCSPCPWYHMHTISQYRMCRRSFPVLKLPSYRIYKTPGIRHKTWPKIRRPSAVRRLRIVQQPPKIRQPSSVRLPRIVR